MHPLRVKRRNDQPEKIDEAHDHDRARDHGQRARVALQVARQQEHKRQGEMKNDQHDAEPLPAALQAADRPKPFFRPVAGTDQPRSHWANAMEARSRTNANSRPPRSWKCTGEITRESGARSASRAATMMAKAKALSPCPTMSVAPKIVEYQCGSSDISQSTAAKVMASPYRINPGPLRRRRRRVGRGSAAR